MAARRDQLAVTVILAAVALASVASLGWLLAQQGRQGARAPAPAEVQRSAPGALERVLADVSSIAPDRQRVVLRAEDESLALELDQPLPGAISAGDPIEAEGREIGRSRFGARYLRGRLLRHRRLGPAVQAGPRAPSASASPGDRPAWSRSRLGAVMKKVRR